MDPSPQWSSGEVTDVRTVAADSVNIDLLQPCSVCLIAVSGHYLSTSGTITEELLIFYY